MGAANTTSLVPAFVTGSGATSPTAQLSFTLDSGASSCFFRDCIVLSPLHTLVSDALADPSVGPDIAHGTTTLPFLAAPSGFLTGYYTPSFYKNLVGVSHLHDLGVVTTFPLDEPVASCTVGATGAPLTTFHREPSFGLYSLHTGSHHTRSVTRPTSPLACTTMHPLRRGSAARCPSLLLVPPHHGSLRDPALGRLGPLPGPWPTSGALLPDCGGRLLPLHHSFSLGFTLGGLTTPHPLASHLSHSSLLLHLCGQLLRSLGVVSAGGIGDTGGVVAGGSGTGGVGAGDTCTAMPTLRTAEQQRLRDLPDPAPTRWVRGPLPYVDVDGDDDVGPEDEMGEDGASTDVDGDAGP
ncbi:unnamed protein product [Closterium sp. NIES-54]